MWRGSLQDTTLRRWHSAEHVTDSTAIRHRQMMHGPGDGYVERRLRSRSVVVLGCHVGMMTWSNSGLWPCGCMVTMMPCSYEVL